MNITVKYLIRRPVKIGHRTSLCTVAEPILHNVVLPGKDSIQSQYHSYWNPAVRGESVEKNHAQKIIN